jgi:hypothetical protein
MTCPCCTGRIWLVDVAKGNIDEIDDSRLCIECKAKAAKLILDMPEMG